MTVYNMLKTRQIDAATYDDRVRVIKQLGEHVLQSNARRRYMLKISHHGYCATAAKTFFGLLNELH